MLILIKTTLETVNTGTSVGVTPNFFWFSIEEGMLRFVILSFKDNNYIPITGLQRSILMLSQYLPPRRLMYAKFVNVYIRYRPATVRSFYCLLDSRLCW